MFTLETTKVRVKDNLYDKKIEAAKKLNDCFDTIRNEKIKRQIYIDQNIDVNMTGMIGERYTEITTTLGNLESKRTSTNSNIVTMIIDMITEAGLEKGDQVAINLSGSFPAINLAAIVAAEELELELLIISSIGSSSYGANIPDFTYLDMEKLLYLKGLISNRSIAFSYGGSNDQGVNINISKLENIRNRHLNLLFLDYSDFEENVYRRKELYYSNNDVDLFINVGGNMVSGGKRDFGFGFDNGLINPNTKLNFNKDGLIGQFLSEGVPVINLLDIKDLAIQYDLSIDSMPLPGIGNDGSFYRNRYNPVVLLMTVIFGGGSIAYYGVKRRKKIEIQLQDIKQ